MKSEMALIGLVVGVVGLLVALAIRARWARPLGALLLAVAVAAEIVAVQAHTGARAEDGIKPTTPIPTVVVTTPSSQPTSTTTPTFVILPKLLTQVHPGVEPIVKTITVNKEFVRLLNAGTVPKHVNGWKLSNGTLIYTFPDVTIPPHGSIVVRSGVGTNTATVLHWNRTSYVWPRNGGHITLRDGQGRLIDQCTYRISDAQIQAGDASASC